MHTAAVVFALVFSVLLAGCAGGQRVADEARVNCTFIYLKSGPRSGEGTPEQRREIFRGHMSNMQRLAQEGHLLVAGPWSKPQDRTWRGLFIMASNDPREALRLAESDPGVMAGEFVLEAHAMRGSDSIARAPEAERQWQSERASMSGEKPPEVRGYVMITAARGSHAERSLRRSSLWSRVLWHGTFDDTGAGVFVIDAETPEAVQADLAGTDVGPHTVDGWWSAASLARLAAPR